MFRRDSNQDYEEVKFKLNNQNTDRTEGTLFLFASRSFATRGPISAAAAVPSGISEPGVSKIRTGVDSIRTRSVLLGLAAAIPTVSGYQPCLKGFVVLWPRCIASSQLRTVRSTIYYFNDQATRNKYERESLLQLGISGTRRNSPATVNRNWLAGHKWSNLSQDPGDISVGD